MEGGAICLPQTEVLEWSWWFSVRWFLDVNGEGTDRATSVFVWCPALVVYRFSRTSDFFSPHPIKFSLKTFLVLNFSLVSTWLHLFITGWLLWSLCCCHSLRHSLSCLWWAAASRSVIRAQNILECESSSESVLALSHQSAVPRDLAHQVTCCQRGQAL